MRKKKIDINKNMNTTEAFGRIFVKGNIPEIDAIHCSGCSHCVTLCKKLGPNVLESKEGAASVVRPENCIGCGACMLNCPRRAIFIMSKHNTDSPPDAAKFKIKFNLLVN